jgi:hypothetical protein
MQTIPDMLLMLVLLLQYSVRASSFILFVQP